MKLLQILFLCFVSSSVYAQYEFSEHIVFDDSQSAYGVNIIESADMDANGYKDIVFYAEAENKLAIIPNGPNGFGDQIVLLNDAANITDVDLVDVDKDGDLDVTLLYHNIRQIYALMNDEGVYVQQLLTNEDQFYFIGNEIDWVDMNGDGKLDVLSLVYNDRLHYLRNVSQDEFKLSAHQEVYSSDGRMSYDVADLDKDGLMDVVSTDANRVIIHKQVSNQVFEEEVLDIDVGHFGLVKVSDIDYDGDNDIVVMQNLAWEMGEFGFVRVFENVQDEWVMSSSYFPQLLRVWDFSLVDIDYDNDLDIVGIQHSETIIVYNNDNSYDEVNELESNAYRPVALLVADFDNDIDLDIVTANELDSAISYFENRAQGFQSSFLSIEHVKPSVLVSGDSNGDEYNDILIGFAKTGELIWYEGNGQGFDKGSITPDIGVIVEIENVDVDRDGVEEYYTSSHTPGVLGKLEYSADNQQWEYQSIVENISSNTLGVGMSNDGMKYSILSSSELFTSLVLHELYVGFSFQLPPVVLDDDIGYLVFSQFYDLDDDGYDDIVYASLEGELKVIWNIDGTTYGEPVQIDSTGYRSQDFLIEDFNNDGFKDIIVANSEREALAVYLSDGSGQLDAVVWDAGLPNIKRIHMVDIDNDGDLDFVGGLDTVGRIAIYEYNHSIDEYMSPLVLDSELSNISKIIAQDVDLDGDNDLVAISFNDSSMAWYENLFINTSTQAQEHVEIIVSPNPAIDRLVIDLDHPFDEVLMSDVLGNTVLRKSDGDLNVELLPSGMYLVQVFRDGHVLGVKSVILQK